MSRPAPLAVALSGSAALAVAMGIGRFAFTPILPMMQAQSGVSLAEGSWLASANYIGYLVGALSAARPVPPRRAMLAALAAIAISTAAMALAQNLAAWLALRFVAGVASAWVLVQVSSWGLGRLTAAARPLLAGALFAGVGAGIALAGIACLALMRAGLGPETAWLVLGALALGVTAAVCPVLGLDGAGPAGKSRGHPFVWTPEAVLLVACYGAFGFGYIVPATFVPVMARAVVDDARIFGWAWPVFGLTAAASTLLAATLLRVAGNRRVWRLGVIAMGLGVAGPLLLQGAAGIFLAAFLVGGTFMVITMAGLQEARRVAAAQAPMLIAAMTAAFALGQIAGPLAVPLLVRYGGFPAVLLVASTVLALSGILLPKEKR